MPESSPVPAPSSVPPVAMPPAPSPAALLQNVTVAKPCHESWDAMPGGERVRSCASCKHKVYNLSAMTAAEAADLLRNAEGRVCVRFYRRADGTIMTADCPVGLQAARKKMARAASVAFASAAMLCGVSLVGKSREEQPRFVQWVLNVLNPESTPEPTTEPTTGNIATPRFIPLPIATPMPVANPKETMGKVAVVPEPPPVPIQPQYTMGDMAYVPPAPPPIEKPFLRGLEKEMQPESRPDPFAPHDKKAPRR